MKMYTFYLYVNGVHCEDIDIEATSEDEAKKKLDETTWYEKVHLASVKDL